ncbi:MAG TPA: hypothetical protein VGO30_12585 [Mycobacterium sp.]|nr:hypothetical protein [Mycobacterium sp.]
MITGRCAAMRRLAIVAGIPLVLLSSTAIPAMADSAFAGADLVVAQTLGDRELTVVLRRVTSVPGPLSVDLITHAGTAPGRLALEVTPTGTTSAAPGSSAPGAPTAKATVELGAQAGSYSAAVPVDRPGPWELAIGDGQRTARIPFVVTKQIVSPPERVAYGGLITAGAQLVASGIVAARVLRGGWALVPAGGALAAVSVAVTAALLTPSLPLPPQPGSQIDPSVDNVGDPYALKKPLITEYSRPPVTLTLHGAALVGGIAADVDLELTDGSTGLPVDDLIVHDDALLHLLVIGPTGQLWHLHPIRTAPGRYQQHLVVPVPGHYAVSAEMVRRGGGVQGVRAATGFNAVAASSPGASATGPAANLVHIDGSSLAATTSVGSTRVSLITTRPVAGVPVTVAARVGEIADLQLWLGMVGHMIVTGPLPATNTNDIGTAVQSAPVWAHAHSMGGVLASAPSMAAMTMTNPTDGVDNPMDAMMAMNPVNGDSAPDETVAGYGPDVPFTFTFPAAGQYRLWVQVERDYTLLTIPVVIDVVDGSAVQGIRP